MDPTRFLGRGIFGGLHILSRAAIDDTNRSGAGQTMRKKKLDEIDSRVKDLVKECEKFAEESSYPDKNLMYDAVYEQKDYPFLKHKI